MHRLITQIASGTTEIFFPLICVVCRMRGSNLCAKCVMKLVLVSATSCPNCNRVQNSLKVCRNCSRSIKLAGLIAPVRPTEEIKAAIKEYKYRGIKDLRIELGTILSYAVKKNASKYDLIMPVPISRERFRERGYNQSELLAKEVSINTGIPMTQSLKKIKNTRHQVGLGRLERLKNLTGSFRAHSNVQGKRILLIDDVATTLSTLNECASELKNAGAKSVWGAVLYKD